MANESYNIGRWVSGRAKACLVGGSSGWWWWWWWLVGSHLEEHRPNVYSFVIVQPTLDRVGPFVTSNGLMSITWQNYFIVYVSDCLRATIFICSIIIKSHTYKICLSVKDDCFGIQIEIVEGNFLRDSSIDYETSLYPSLFLPLCKLMI